MTVNLVLPMDLCIFFRKDNKDVVKVSDFINTRKIRLG